MGDPQIQHKPGGSQPKHNQNQPASDPLVDFIYLVENHRYNLNTDAPSQQQVQALTASLKAVLNVRIRGFQQIQFIEHVIEFIKLIMNFICAEDEYKKQKNYAGALLGFIPNFFEELQMRNVFFIHATVQIFDLFLFGHYCAVAKKELLKIYNIIITSTEKQIRIETSRKLIDYVFKLVDSLATYGDFVLQCDTMETVFRVYGHLIRNNLLPYELVPNMGELNTALAKEISVNGFDADIRRWLNKFNIDSKNIFSIACKKLLFGDTECQCPEQDGIWIDFDLKDGLISFYVDDDVEWNRLIILTTDVKKVEINRQMRSTTTISMHLSKPCLSDFPVRQKYYNSLDKHFQLVLDNEQKEHVTKLISQVLPRLFGVSFSHTSARVSDKLKRVYRPLGIKISKKMSSSSGLSSAPSRPSRSDTTEERDASFNMQNLPREPSPLITSDKSDFQIKNSALGANGDDISVAVTDLTRSSAHQSGVLSRQTSIISVNSDHMQEISNHFEEADIQDNIVSSSYRLGEETSQIEILTGHSGGSQPLPIHRDKDFNPSELLSSSPIKRSRFAAKLSDDDDQSEVVRHTQPVNTTRKQAIDQKYSAFKESEELFETAKEALSDAEISADSDGVKRSTLNQVEADASATQDSLQSDRDLFEQPTQPNSCNKVPKETAPFPTESLSQDIFSVPTQKNQQEVQDVDQNFTEASLSVQIGVAESQDSQNIVKLIGDVAQNKSECVVKTNVVQQENMFVNTQELLSILGRNTASESSADKKLSSAILLDSQPEVVIDLTNEEVIAEKVTTEESIKCLKESAADDQPLTLNSLDTGTQISSQSQLTMNKDIPKKKKSKKMIKTGKKEFRIDDDIADDIPQTIESVKELTEADKELQKQQNESTIIENEVIVEENKLGEVEKSVLSQKESEYTEEALFKIPAKLNLLKRKPEETNTQSVPPRKELVIKLTDDVPQTQIADSEKQLTDSDKEILKELSETPLQNKVTIEENGPEKIEIVEDDLEQPVIKKPIKISQVKRKVKQAKVLSDTPLQNKVTIEENGPEKSEIVEDDLEQRVIKKPIKISQVKRKVKQAKVKTKKPRSPLKDLNLNLPIKKIEHKQDDLSPLKSNCKDIENKNVEVEKAKDTSKTTQFQSGKETTENLTKKDGQISKIASKLDEIISYDIAQSQTAVAKKQTVPKPTVQPPLQQWENIVLEESGIQLNVVIRSDANNQSSLSPDSYPRVDLLTTKADEAAIKYPTIFSDSRGEKKSNETGKLADTHQFKEPKIPKPTIRQPIEECDDVVLEESGKHLNVERPSNKSYCLSPDLSPKIASPAAATKPAEAEVVTPTKICNTLYDSLLELRFREELNKSVYLADIGQSKEQAIAKQCPEKTKPTSPVEFIPEKSQDTFDKVFGLDVEQNKSKLDQNKNLNTTVAGVRRLYKEGSFSYLDDLAIPEQETPDYSEDQPPVKKIKSAKKPADKVKKEKTNRKSVESAKKTPNKKDEKPRKTRRKKQFEFSTTNFKTLDELFDRSCAGIDRSCSYQYKFGGYNNKSAYYDLTARAAPPHRSSSSDDDIPLLAVKHNNMSPRIPKKLPVLEDSTEESQKTWPELEIESENLAKPVTIEEPGVKEPTPKIKILGNVLIQPKRRQTETDNTSQAKKIKMAVEDVPLPPLMLDDEFQENKNLPSAEKQGEKDDCITQLQKIFNYVLPLLKRSNNETLRKLKAINDFINKL